MVLHARQHALITGGSSGIGKATACLLAGRGLHISIIARGHERLLQARAEIERACIDSGQRVLALAADVADRAAVEQAIDEICSESGVPDLVITSAGIALPGMAYDLPVDVFEQTMAVNYLGSVYAIKAVLPAMRERRQGHLVLISSGAGLLGIYGYTAYGASKFAVRGLAEALRSELKPDNIGVSIVYPPDTDTPQLAEEQKHKPAATSRITGSAGVMSAEQVAQAIMKGIDRQTFVIAPGMEMFWLARLHSVIAPLLNYYFDRLIRQALHHDRQ